VRIAIVGATGSLGAELLAVLDESSLAVTALVPIGTERSLGTEVEFRGGVFPVETELSALRGADFAFLCAPAAVSLEAARSLLRARVGAIDCSGALAMAPEVPLVVELGVAGAPSLEAPILAVPPGLSLACARVLAPIAREFGVARVVATLVLSASATGAGRANIEALAEETIALLTQQELPDPPALGHPVAFDTLPWVGDAEDDGATAHERAFAAVLGRALGGQNLPTRSEPQASEVHQTGDAAVAITSLRIPTFCGDGASLAFETRDDVDPARVLDVLSKLPGVALAGLGPTTRAVAGSDLVQVGRVRTDPSRPGGLLAWLAADSVRLTAVHAVHVAEARFGRV
jgi:aspartate-semialdehyde dehydrogenase